MLNNPSKTQQMKRAIQVRTTRFHYNGCQHNRLYTFTYGTRVTHAYPDRLAHAAWQSFVKRFPVPAEWQNRVVNCGIGQGRKGGGVDVDDVEQFWQV